MLKKRPTPKSSATSALDCNHFRSPCPVACVLDILGDKWTLLVIRDLVLGKTRFKDFLESPEGIPTNILAGRLKRLESHGVVEREFYQQHPPRARYLLTGKGRELGEILKAMAAWGNAHIPGTIRPEDARAKFAAAETSS